MNEAIKPYLAATGNSAEEVDKIFRAWCKSSQLQLALGASPCTYARQAPNEWRSVRRCTLRSMEQLRISETNANIGARQEKKI